MNNFIIIVDLMQKVLEYSTTGWQSETNEEANAVFPGVKNDSSKLLVIFHLHQVHLIKIFPKIQASQIKQKRNKTLGMRKQ